MEGEKNIQTFFLKKENKHQKKSVKEVKFFFQGIDKNVRLVEKRREY